MNRHSELCQWILERWLPLSKYQYAIRPLCSLSGLLLPVKFCWSVCPLITTEILKKQLTRDAVSKLYNFLCLKLWGHSTESHQISTSSTEMIAISLLKSKLRSYNPSGNANVTNEDRQIAGELQQKIVCLNSVNSEIVRRKFTKFGHDVACLLPLTHVKAHLRSANPLSNA